jgi:hypothetical protein
MKFSSYPRVLQRPNYILAMTKTRSKIAKPKDSPLSDRRDREKADEAAAWREYHSAVESLHEKTARLRALRLKRENAHKRRTGRK